MLLCLPEKTPDKQLAFWIGSKRIEPSSALRGGIAESIPNKEDKSRPPLMRLTGTSKNILQVIIVLQFCSIIYIL